MNRTNSGSGSFLCYRRVEGRDPSARSGGEEVVPVDLGGYVVCVRASDQDFGRAIIATRDYEPHLRRIPGSSVRPGQVVRDVGANIGCLTFQAARLVGNEGG